MAFESRGAPHRDRILRFAGLWRESAVSGADALQVGRGPGRAGAGLAILFEGGTAAEALEQLSWRFGHWSRARTGVLDAFFVRYAAEAEGRIRSCNGWRRSTTKPG